VEEESLFVNEILIEMPIATNNSENGRNEESKLDDSIYINRAMAGEKILKNIQIYKDIASRQISDNENSPVDSILVEI
jgi:hypothetical protein